AETTEPNIGSASASCGGGRAEIRLVGSPLHWGHDRPWAVLVPEPGERALGAPGRRRRAGHGGGNDRLRSVLAAHPAGVRVRGPRADGPDAEPAGAARHEGGHPAVAAHGEVRAGATETV